MRPAISELGKQFLRDDVAADAVLTAILNNPYAVAMRQEIWVDVPATASRPAMRISVVRSPAPEFD
ncbi:hypothetical protein [Chitinophaga alhagiae]|uniref:hypothetical protein n=1 Tax=Chitinophaga alhagiae TaxID=2203219 RepID=UPI000E5A3103|nr:hypothetical protein [Chitinophaga alhagiae]